MKQDFARSPAGGSRVDSAFSHVLDEVGRSDDGERRLGSVDAALGRSFASFAAPFAPDAKGQYGPSEGWDQALDWVAEPQEAAPAVVGPPSDDPDAIAAELGLSSALTYDQLNRARRRFMWNNHPDRRPDVPRDLANRRVAIANMLVDRAQGALARGRRAR
ncbi:MAG: hypothetical protein ABR863_04830 [Roseiarcus sp.]